MIIVPIVGNAAEHFSALQMAWQDRLDVTLAQRLECAANAVGGHVIHATPGPGGGQEPQPIAFLRARE